MRSITTRPTPHCPGCNSQRVVPIVFGYPTPDAMEAVEEGKIMLGGCIVEEGNPNWHCKDCDHEW